MGLDIGGNIITQAGAVLTINTGKPMMLRSDGGVVRPNQIQFVAVGVTAGWVAFVDAQWQKMAFPSALVNVNACYDTVNSRFTAPVTGMYFFQASCYCVKNSVSDGYFWHPMFAINGSLGVRTVNESYPDYRIRGHGQPIATYVDTDVREIYSLVAGDYVEHYTYCTGANNSNWIPSQSRFTGFMLG
jgi:hypothetical protein